MGRFSFRPERVNGRLRVAIADSWVEAIPKERRATPDIDDTDVGTAIEIDDQDDAPRSRHAWWRPVNAVMSARLGTAHVGVYDGARWTVFVPKVVELPI